MVEKTKGASLSVIQGMGTLFCLLIAASSLAYNALYLAGQFTYVRPFSYLGGEVSRDAYISQYRPEYPAILYMNQHLPSESLTLFVFLGSRGYYFEGEYRFGEDLFRRVLGSSQSAEEILEGLRSYGASHVLVHIHIFDRWLQDNFFFGKKAIIEEFMSKYVKVIYYKNNYVVLELLNVLS